MACVLVGKVPSVCQLAPASLVANELTGDCPPMTRHSRESLHATAPMPLPPGRGLVGVHARRWPKVAPMAHGAPFACPAAMHEAPAQPTEVNAVLAGAEDRTTDQVAPASVLAVRTAPAGLGSNEAPAATHNEGAPQPTAARLPPRKGLGCPTPEALGTPVVGVLDDEVDEQAAMTSAVVTTRAAAPRRCTRERDLITRSAYEVGWSGW